MSSHQNNGTYGDVDYDHLLNVEHEWTEEQKKDKVIRSELNWKESLPQLVQGYLKYIGRNGIPIAIPGQNEVVSLEYKCSKRPACTPNRHYKIKFYQLQSKL